jgi:hypothetical protein
MNAVAAAVALVTGGQRAATYDGLTGSLHASAVSALPEHATRLCSTPTLTKEIP